MTTETHNDTLALAMAHADCTREKLAEAAKISTNTVDRALRGERVTLRTAVKIAGALKTSVSALKLR